MCKRPYPDPENPNEEEMIQCGICEDWFHRNHLELGGVFPDDYGEMICQFCTKNHPFLAAYALKLAESAKKEEKSDEKELVQGDNGDPKKNLPDQQESSKRKLESVEDGEREAKKVKGEETKPEETNSTPVPRCGSSKEVDSGLDSDSCSSSSSAAIQCTQPLTIAECKNALLFSNDWRKKLCRCQACIAKYKAEGVEFLLQEMDDVDYYVQESHRKGIKVTAYDRGMSEFNKMDRVQQIETLHGYNSMKAELSEFLKSFAREGKVVKKEDIERFFSEMSSKRSDPSFIPSSCR